MTPMHKLLARALDGIEAVPIAERADLYEVAAEVARYKDADLFTSLREAASLLRQAEKYQLTLFHILRLRA